MTAKTDTPVVDFADRVGDDVSAAVGGGPGKVGGIIGGGMRTPLIEGQDGHLAIGPTGGCFGCYVALLAGQMAWDATRRRGLLEECAR